MDGGAMRDLDGLRLLLKMMRKPAQAAGLQALQRFLEAGFDTFAALGRQPEGVAQFLGLIERRESDWVHTLFDADLVACVTKLEQIFAIDHGIESRDERTLRGKPETGTEIEMLDDHPNPVTRCERSDEAFLSTV